MKDMNYEILNSFHQDLIAIMTTQNTTETAQAQNTPEVKFEKV